MNYTSILLLVSCVFGGSMGAICAYLLHLRLRNRFSLRTSAQLSAEITRLNAGLDSLSATVRRLTAREGMRAMRGKRAEEEKSFNADSVDMLPGETRAQWKNRLKKRMANNGEET